MNGFDKNLLNENESENDEQVDESADLILAQPMGEKKIPLFLEFVMTMTKVVVLVSGFFVTIVSIIAKATWYDTLLRVGITLLVLGLFGVMINYFIGKNFVEAAVVELEEAETKRKQKEAEEAESTMDALEA